MQRQEARDKLHDRLVKLGVSLDEFNNNTAYLVAPKNLRDSPSTKATISRPFSVRKLSPAIYTLSLCSNTLSARSPGLLSLDNEWKVQCLASTPSIMRAPLPLKTHGMMYVVCAGLQLHGEHILRQLQHRLSRHAVLMPAGSISKETTSRWLRSTWISS